jgi:membrane associated rhomboid family serine protease/tetratricopeptide (TPR) repeat protein
MDKPGDQPDTVAPGSASVHTLATEEVLPNWLDESAPIPATKLLIWANVIVYLAMTITTVLANFHASDGGMNSREGILFFSSQTLADWGANAAWKTILDRQYWRIFSSTFVHMNALHLAMNMYVLWSFSSMVERLFGKSKFLTIYLLSGLGSSICSLLFLNPGDITVGASGAIFGTFGALVAFFWMHRTHFPKQFFRMYAKMFFVFAIYSLVSPLIFHDMDNAAHLSGFLIGLWAALCLLPIAPGDKVWRNLDYIRIAGLTGILSTGLVIVCTMDERNPQVIGEHDYAEAVRLLRQDKPKQAIFYLDKTLNVMPQNASAYLDRAAAYGKLKQYGKCVDDATMALKYEPANKRGYFERSLAYHNLGDERKAVADLDYLLKLDPRSAVAYNNRGWSCNALGEPDIAIADSTKAISIDPRGAMAYDTRGVALCLKGMYKNALVDFDKYVQLKPGDGAIRYHRAFAYFKLGRKDLSDRDLQIAKASDYQLEPWEKLWLGQMFAPDTNL